MEEMRAHRHPDSRACRTRPSYSQGRPLLLFFRLVPWKANQSESTDQCALCNIINPQLPCSAASLALQPSRARAVSNPAACDTSMPLNSPTP